VVLDAPPTGRICQFLGVNSELAGLAKVGPIKSQADKVMELLRSPRTAVHLVTILEEMPVQETIDGAAELTSLGLNVGGVVVNLVEDSPLEQDVLSAAERGEVDVPLLTAGVGAAGLADHLGVAPLLADQLIEHAQRVALERDERRRLHALGHPIIELPRLPDGIDLGALYQLADRLRGVSAGVTA
jgi:anion-transporting  ArsA/GET3 family ATPase